MQYLPIPVVLAAFLLWWTLCAVHKLPATMFPSPAQVWTGFLQEINSGRLWNDIIASLWRVFIGFGLSVALGVPCGLWLGGSAWARAALMPSVNFLRSLSPIAWIGFAIVWFGVGDKPAIFLIFLSVFFPLTVSVSSSVSTLPSVYFRVARDYGIEGVERLSQVVLPAILPELITALRVSMGIAWVVLVAAEMVGARSGLGFAIYDDRNALRQDLLVVHMIVIGVIGVALDRILLSLKKIPSVRWGYER